MLSQPLAARTQSSANEPLFKDLIPGANPPIRPGALQDLPRQLDLSRCTLLNEVCPSRLSGSLFTTQAREPLTEGSCQNPDTAWKLTESLQSRPPSHRFKAPSVSSCTPNGGLVIVGGRQDGSLNCGLE